MATRNHAPTHQHQRGPTGKQKAAPVAAGDAKNRKALEDIGNMVNLRITEGKPAPNRPITRSFGAQLLANAHAAAAAKNSQNQISLPCGGAGKKKVTVKKSNPEVIVIDVSPAEIHGERKEKKVLTNPEVIVIDVSPASIHGERKEKKVSHASSSKKKAYSLTSVLSARSKIACGIQDIDAEDADNELSMMEYVEDLYKFYKHQENLCRPRDYMSSQIEINAKMRSILVDWLIEVHQKFELMPETLYLTLSIVDRFLSVETVLRKELQLVGVSSMLIACKYEEIWAPAVHDFYCISDEAYCGEQILDMEKRILNRLNWSLTFPTSYVFVVRFLKAASSDKEMECMTFFFAELALMHYSMVMYCPSMVAASAVYAAHCTLNKTPLWTKTLQYHTGFSEPQLRECAELMVGFHSSAREGKLTVIYRKYSKEELGGVALRSPATNFVGKLTQIS